MTHYYAIKWIRFINYYNYLGSAALSNATQHANRSSVKALRLFKKSIFTQEKLQKIL